MIEKGKSMTLRELIDKEEKRITKELAVDEKDCRINPSDPDAVKWSLNGGLSKLKLYGQGYRIALKSAAIRLGIGLRRDGTPTKRTHEICLFAMDALLEWEQFDQWLQEAKI